MKHTHLFLILAAALTLCACEKPTDDRQHETPTGTIYHSFLLNVQVTAIPEDGAYYDLRVRNGNFSPRQLFKANLPEMYRITGGAMDYAQLSVFKLDSLNDETPDTLIYKYNTPYFNLLNDSLGRPQYVDYEENGLAVRLEYRYD